MNRFRCEQCGETFNSKNNLELHEELEVCEENQDNTSHSDRSTDKGRAISSRPKRVKSDATGTVSTFNQDRGFGFVTTADIRRRMEDGTELTEDLFVHITDVDTSWLEEGDRLRFNIVSGEKGLKCENAKLVERSEDRESYEPRERTKSKPEVDDTKHGPGKQSPTNRDIEDFKDDRKFR